MGMLAINFRTDISRDQISHIDIILTHSSDYRLNQYRIITRIPRGNLRDLSRLIEIQNLAQGNTYMLVVRLFTRNSPYFVLRTVSVQMAREVCRGRLWWRNCSTDVTVVQVELN